jgi:hypothetical protein
MKYEALREAWRITERRDGATYKTERIGEIWLPFDETHDVAQRDPNDPDIIYVSIPTQRTEELLSQGITSPRRRKEN